MWNYCERYWCFLTPRPGAQWLQQLWIQTQNQRVLLRTISVCSRAYCNDIPRATWGCRHQSSCSPRWGYRGSGVCTKLSFNWTEQYHKVWYKLYISPDATKWSNVLVFCELCFSLPFSNSSVERMFSALKLTAGQGFIRTHWVTSWRFNWRVPLLEAFHPSKLWKPGGRTVRLYADLTKVLAKSMLHDKLPKWVQAHLLLNKSQKVKCHFHCSNGMHGVVTLTRLTVISLTTELCYNTV